MNRNPPLSEKEVAKTKVVEVVVLVDSCVRTVEHVFNDGIRGGSMGVTSVHPAVTIVTKRSFGEGVVVLTTEIGLRGRGRERRGRVTLSGHC